MKTLLFFCLVLSVATAAHAQSSANESATISAEVVAALSVSKNQNLAFGDIAQNTSSSVAVTDAGAVKFTITGEPSKNVTFSLTSPANLTNGGNTMAFTGDVKYNNSTDAPASASDLSNGATIALNGSGNMYVYLGGSITAGASQVTGSYSGTYTLEIDY